MILFLFQLIILGLVPPVSHHEVIIANHGLPLLSQNKHLTLLTPQHYEEWLIDFDQWFQTRRNVLPWFQSSFIESLKSLGKWVKYFKCSLTWSILPVLMNIRYAFPIHRYLVFIFAYLFILIIWNYNSVSIKNTIYSTNIAKHINKYEFFIFLYCIPQLKNVL